MLELGRFHSKIEKLYVEMRKRHSKTVSDEVFKITVRDIFKEWKTIVRPRIVTFKLLDKRQIRKLDSFVNGLYKFSSARVADTKEVRSNLSELNELLFKYELVVSSKGRKTMAATVSEREDLLKRLDLNLKHFDVAVNYFEEAKSCFKYGFLRAATIVAISALESCLRMDYFRIKNEEYDGKLSNLINRYFSGDLKRLPKQYEDFTNTYVKIRNSFTHPEEFDYSENIVFNVLCTVAELMKAIEKHY